MGSKLNHIDPTFSMDKNRYYWDITSYVPNPDRPLNCEVEFDASNEYMKDVSKTKFRTAKGQPARSVLNISCNLLCYLSDLSTRLQ